jgi:sugar phosphate isomerase/epimerase
MSPENSVRLGIDIYSLRSQGWNAFQVLDYCHRQGSKVVHFSETRLLGGIEESRLQRVRIRAGELGLDLEIGMLSICPLSNLFDASRGTAEEQLSAMIAAARTVGSPIVRAVMGNAADRRGAIPFVELLRSTVGVLRSVASRARDAGVKIAIENHSGDMQAWQLAQLIEDAGPDFVGACIDSGNPLITLEDPHGALETLAPYVLTSHIRDSAVWLTGDGAATAWVRMGEGNVGIDQYIRRYAQLCPGRALSLEIIVSPRLRPFPFRSPEFWNAYSEVRAPQFFRFLEIAERGGPCAFTDGAADPAMKEREDFEASLQYVKRLIGRGK